MRWMLTLAITRFDVMPQLVSDILQLEPTSTAIKGQLGKSGRPYSSNCWWLEVHPERLINGSDHAQAISVMTNLLRGKEGAFHRLVEEVKPESVTLYGGIYITAESQNGLWLEASEMAILAACGIGWGVDIFIE